MAHHTSNHRSVTCPIARTTEIICGKWTLLIIRDLARETKRFCQLERSLEGISPKTLTDRLHTLEREGIISRQMFGEVPPRVEYSLTEKGHALAAIIEAMRVFGTQWLMADGPCDGEALLDHAAQKELAVLAAK
jgi:DNA-binding HxlR family transcriptional regulator